MFLLLTLPILVSGFYICHHHPLYKQKIYRYEGQYLYLLCAKNGIYSLIFASLIALTLPHTIAAHFSTGEISTVLNWIRGLFNQISAFNSQQQASLFWLFMLSILTFVVAWLWCQLAFVRYCTIYKTTQPKLHLAYQVLSDSPLDKLLFESMLDKTSDNLLMLSMSDRKVYVGSVVSMGEPNELEGPDQEVTLLLVMSGYRNKDTLHVTFNNEYSDTQVKIEITLRQDTIVSATQFSYQAYRELNKTSHKTKPKFQQLSQASVFINSE